MKQSRYAIGLYRVWTAEQGHSGLGLEAQRASVRACMATQVSMLGAEHEDIASGKDDHRPGFQAALAGCRQLGVVLVAAQPDLVRRRARTLLQLLEKGVAIRAAIMPGADELMLRIYAAMAQKERELISLPVRASPVAKAWVLELVKQSAEIERSCEKTHRSRHHRVQRRSLLR